MQLFNYLNIINKKKARYCLCKKKEFVVKLKFVLKLDSFYD